ncbi:MAG TPA: putative glycoside hydrolase [Anaerolineales bacterium]|nr:putative glycoside hydrolase [Anaerolineales bacterium]
MSKATSLLMAFTVVFALTVGLIIPGRAAPQTAPMPSRTINIAHFFKPPNMDAATAARTFGTVILTGGDHSYKNQLAANGFSSDVAQYLRADGIQDPGSCTETPLNNQVAYSTGDFCYISQNHPDWFLLDAYGRRITVTSSGDYYRMDPANDGWRNFFLTRVLEVQNQHGWSGLFLDNVEGSLSKFYGPRPVRYPDNASYQNAVAGFLQYLKVNYSQRYGRPLIGNIVARADDAVWFTYLQYLDGAMQERFAVGWDETGYLDVDDWEEDLALMERTQASGKYVILIAPGNRSDLRRQTFAFASYLLMSQGNAAFRYSTDDAYREVWLYDNYSMDLGAPLGPRYRQGNLWRRDFNRGYVIVDPINHQGTIYISEPTLFWDVPSSYWAWNQIERLYSAGITGGCNTSPLRYCPENSVTRAEMAVFLLRGRHGISYTPPSVGGGTGFGDVPANHWAASWIKQLAAEGITSGCGGGNYCPNSLVTRAEMSIFLLRGSHSATYTPPSVGSSTGFSDVPADHWAASWIKQLAAEGITGGCGGGNYCPNATVTRSQMAVFLVKTFQLP